LRRSWSARLAHPSVRRRIVEQKVTATSEFAPKSEDGHEAAHEASPVSATRPILRPHP
jgi:hypothetical protein